MLEFKGKIRKFGDNIDTDIIAPSKWMHEEMELLKQHSFEAIRPGFYQQSEVGDILLAGRNFGYGSHREQANTVIQALGISLIIADSMARIYYRNCIALGMPAVIIPDISLALEEGDEVSIVLDKQGGLITKTDGWQKKLPALPQVFFQMVEQGGIMPLIKQVAGK